MLKKVDKNVLRLSIVFFAFLIIAVITKGNAFVKLGNFQTMGRQLAEYGLMALGCGLCMIAGGIDLSCVYIANLSGIIVALLMRDMGVPIIICMIVALAIGALCGVCNGVLITYFKIPAMLATLGTSQLFLGISIILSSGKAVSGLPEEYTFFGTALVTIVPFAFVVFVCAVIVVSLIMSKTVFGQRVYLVGANEKCATFAGINNHSIIIKTYLISGVLSSIAGLLSLARINSAKADFGVSYTMQIILIAVLGGVNPNGGFGSIPGVAISVLILQMMSTYLNTFPNISNYYRDLIWGVALIGVLIINYISDKRKTEKLMKSN
ncbi:sugar ABC transporter permease [Candidatus Epulonipiscium fishelsonii]|uniref:Sugar ABC transporter permease n=1 Tax=Candidatus Epulonipiscium fishelsonii TaxID=77094 RepID=A0ACC8XFG7_9FIRM|nr:sugar ABC transporter permease [Epulopiscium sp. SCG-B05WGA-EpuloA1]ONI41899.1 sugar ABC transporter permease [Epulopiscium sp. SCG-B11WGA-EpuloA1]ONI47094.1 sugar ABC transporter permease [Epulopiscium sp. SCG-C06WGA-EpuloA1]